MPNFPAEATFDYSSKLTDYNQTVIRNGVQRAKTKSGLTNIRWRVKPRKETETIERSMFIK